MYNGKKILGVALMAALILVLILAWQGQFSFFSQLKGFQDRANEFLTEELQRRVNTPEPLRGPEEGPAHLTREGVIELTNRKREERGLPPLKENSKLNQSAILKVADMFEDQYFSHISPDGEGVSDLADRTGYNYVLLGENLALGNFENDEKLIQAWMDSPGHRENILHEGYTEIGVGVAQGSFGGNTIWLAVQHFGKPKSACPSPDENLQAQIESNKKEIDRLEVKIEEKRREVENHEPKRGPEYKRKVREYNTLVDSYNALVEETKNIVSTYNEQVREFNACASG